MLHVNSPQIATEWRHTCARARSDIFETETFAVLADIINLFLKFEEFLEPDHCKSCPKNAECALNVKGEHVCSCIEGYVGSGKTCRKTIKRGEISNISCFTVPAICRRCNANAKCVQSKGVYSCKCNNGFIGNGFSCSACFRSLDG